MALRPGVSRALRMTLFVVLVAAAAGAVVLYRAEARLAAPLLDVGRQMSAYAVPRDGDGGAAPGREIWVNGERAWVGVARRDEGVSRVLDHFESRCREGSFDLAGELVEGPGLGAHLDGVLRAENDGAGFVACVDAPEDASVGDRLGAFDRSGDLGDFGDLRYAYAQRRSGRTLVTGVWTRGTFRIGRMFPERGDAPGRDVPDDPRPPGARRVLSTWEGDLPYRMTLYTSEGRSPGEVAASVERSLGDAGWRVTPEARPESTGEIVLSAAREGRSVMVIVTPDPDLEVATVVLEPG
jgi:hypothetical protein